MAAQRLRTVVADATPVDAFLRAYAPQYGLKFRACGNATISGRYTIGDAADIGLILAEAGRRVEWQGDTLLVDCDAADQLTPSYGGEIVGNIAADAIGIGQAPIGQGRGAPHTRSVPGQFPATPEPVEYRAMDTQYLPGRRLDPIRALGLDILADPDIPGPLLLAGPAKIVDQAERYIRSIDVCPRQLAIEATVVVRANVQNRSRGFGIRLGSAEIGVGTRNPGDGSPDTGLNFSLLSAFLEASRGEFETARNASFMGRLVEGGKLALSDGDDVPIRAATSVTDRETRQDIVYRTAGHSLAVQALAIGEEILLQVDHSISALGPDTELGPTFSTRSTSSLIRVRYREPVVLSLAGADVAERGKTKGILARSDRLSSSETGAFLVLAVDRIDCLGGLAGRESAQRSALPVQDKARGPKVRVQ